MPSPLETAITHRWPLGGDYLDKVGTKHLTGSGSITQVAGQIPSSVASLFGAAYADCMTINHDAASDLDFTTDWSLGFFVKLAAGTGNVYPITKGQWYSYFEMAVSSTNGGVGLLLGNGTANTSPIAAAAYSNGALVVGEWGFIGVRHKASTQEVWLYAGKAQRGDGLQCLYRKYTTTRSRSTLPLRFNGLSSSAGSVPGNAPYTMQEVNFSPTLITEFDMLALYNQGQGILPPYSAYQTQGQVPGLVTARRLAKTTPPTSGTMAQRWVASSGPDTSRTDPIYVPYPTSQLRFCWINSTQIFEPNNSGEAVNPERRSTMSWEAAVYVEGEPGPPIRLTFSGNNVGNAAYGELVWNDPVPNRIFYPNQAIRVTTYYTPETNTGYIPGAIQFAGDGGRFGNTSNNIFDTTTANFAQGRGGYGFGPTLMDGFPVGPAKIDTTVVARGDSTSAIDNQTWLSILANTSGIPTMQAGLAGASSTSYAVAGREIALATMSKYAERLIDMLGINDLQSGERTFLDLKTAKTTCWQRWLGTGSNVRQLIVSTLTPMTVTNLATAPRADFHIFLRTATNAEIGAMTGRPTLVYRWNWGTSQWVAAAGGRSSGSGNPLDVYVMDIAYCIEGNPATNDNTWNTVAGTNRVVADAATIADKIHPSPATSAAIAAVFQPQYNAAMTAALPAAYNITNVVIDQPDQTTTVSGSISFTATQTYTGSVPPAVTWSVTNVSGRVGTINPATGVYTPNPLVGATPNVDTVTATSANGLTSSRTVTTPAAGSGSGRKKFVGKMTTNPTITTGTWVPITTNGNGFSVSPRNGQIEVFFKTTPPLTSDLGEPVDPGKYREFGEPAAGTIAYLRAIGTDCKVALSV